MGPRVIGASVSEPLSSDLNVNFVCLSVCLSVCHGPSTYRKSLPALILRVLRHAFNSKTTRDMNHGQSNSTMATRTETTHRLTYSMARAIDILNRMAICRCHLSLLPDSRCLCQSLWTPTSSNNSAKEATGSACKRR